MYEEYLRTSQKNNECSSPELIKKRKLSHRTTVHTCYIEQSFNARKYWPQIFTLNEFRIFHPGRNSL